MSLLENIKFYKAHIAFQNKNYEKALSIYEKATSKKNPNVIFIIKYAYTAVFSGNNELCKKQLDRINYDSITDPNIKLIYKQTEGLYLWKTNKIEEAIKIYTDLNLNYKNSTNYETLGYLLLINNQYEEALKINLEAYNYSNENNVILDNLAESYYFLGELDKAKELYEKMHGPENSKKPTFPEAYFYYGLILKENGEIEKAKDYLNKALEMKESNLSILTHEIISKELDKI